MANNSQQNHQYREAFRLMKYASEDGQIVEWIWNSRNGVTPFYVTAQDDETPLRHVQWHFDIFAPTYQPLPGERVFVDRTPELARKAAIATVQKYWDDEACRLRQVYETKEQAIAGLSKIQHPGEPTLSSGAEYYSSRFTGSAPIEHI